MGIDEDACMDTLGTDECEGLDSNDDRNPEDGDFDLDDNGEDGTFDFFTGQVAADEGISDSLEFKSDLWQAWTWRPIPKSNEDLYIRVLDIEPAHNKEEPLKCHLRLTSLMKAPWIYQALSYAWGTGQRSECIEIDDAFLYITKTLQMALNRIREQWDKAELLYDDRRPALWVDAICINQNDELEKSSQVSAMGAIYEMAQRVLIWLGEPDRIEARMASELHSISLSAARRFDEDLYLESGQPFRLVEKPWFRRRWTIQETLLQQNRTFLIGQFAFPFSTSTSTLESLHSVPTSWNYNTSILTTRRTLLHNMLHFRQTQCVDDRDRLYALRDISSDGYVVPVEYGHDVAHVYTNFAETYTRTEWLSTLLLCAILFRGRSLPTWVPDWREVPLMDHDSRRLIEKPFHPRLSTTANGLPNLSTNCRAPVLCVNTWMIVPCDHESQRTFDRSCYYCQVRYAEGGQITSASGERYTQPLTSGVHWHNLENFWIERGGNLDGLLPSADVYCIFTDANVVFGLERLSTNELQGYTFKEEGANVEEEKVLYTLKFFDPVRHVKFGEDGRISSCEIRFTKGLDPRRILTTKLQKAAIKIV